MSIETILRDELNIVGPMRHIFGDEIGDALEVLLAQEAEHVAHLIRDALTGDEAVVYEVGEAIEDAALTYLGQDLGTIHRADIARAGLTRAAELLGGK